MNDTFETTHPTLLVRAAAFEALVASGLDSFTEADLDSALSWLAEPARSETVQALQRSGWLKAGAAGWTPTRTGLQVYEALRTTARAGLPYPGLPGGITPDQLVRALLGRTLEELATAGRDALVPILSAAPLLTTRAVARAAETHARHGRPEAE